MEEFFFILTIYPPISVVLLQKMKIPQGSLVLILWLLAFRRISLPFHPLPLSTFWTWARWTRLNQGEASREAQCWTRWPLRFHPILSRWCCIHELSELLKGGRRAFSIPSTEMLLGWWQRTRQQYLFHGYGLYTCLTGSAGAGEGRASLTMAHAVFTVWITE